jgi:hypothetical protein
MLEKKMTAQKLKFRRFGSMAVGLLLAGLTAGLSIDLVRDSMHPAAPQLSQMDKRQLALLGGLELERAVQAFKDCILRGDSAYSAEFNRHMEEVERAVLLYRASGTLNSDEQETLSRLQEVVPRYRTAIYVVRRMHGESATINEIDSAVKGADRPISAAFDQLEVDASDQVSSRIAPSPSRRAVGALLCAGLASIFFLHFAFASSGHPDEGAGGDDRSLKELSMRMMRWEEAKEAKAFSVLHDGVCQSLSAIMYLLKSGESFAADRSNASLRSLVEPIIPSLQAAICETRAIALDLCPPRLQESGLRGTLDSVLDDCQARRPDIRIVSRTFVEESDVPELLKPVILRIARMTSDWAFQESSIHELSWELKRQQDQIRLTVQFLFGAEGGGVGTSAGPSQETSLDLPHVIRARVILSGGTSGGVREIPGGLALIATWPLAGSCTI